MINAGAILVCALLKTLVRPEMTLAEKFDFTMNYFEVNNPSTAVGCPRTKMCNFSETCGWRRLRI